MLKNCCYRLLNQATTRPSITLKTMPQYDPLPPPLLLSTSNFPNLKLDRVPWMHNHWSLVHLSSENWEWQRNGMETALLGAKELFSTARSSLPIQHAKQAHFCSPLGILFFTAKWTSVVSHLYIRVESCSKWRITETLRARCPFFTTCYPT